MTNRFATEPAALTMPGRRPETTPEEALAVFNKRDDLAEPLTASEVNEELDCSKRTTLRLLDQLVEDGELKEKKPGSRAKVWWVPISDTATSTVTKHRREPGREPIDEQREAQTNNRS